ncbi:6618_t:CDS:2 [Dentiscutata erythropus]|uniref:6618_t:CDS:1 n=1 Tax=Dentiscutata erythropus TaxID=1348616 RepID=A0A9N9CG10_9GLOM|nr:6618_t:CDS:2 [Dentiscutata erythropus]
MVDLHDFYQIGQSERKDTHDVQNQSDNEKREPWRSGSSGTTGNYFQGGSEPSSKRDV